MLGLRPRLFFPDFLTSLTPQLFWPVLHLNEWFHLEVFFKISSLIAKLSRLQFKAFRLEAWSREKSLEGCTPRLLILHFTLISHSPCWLGPWTP